MGGLQDARRTAVAGRRRRAIPQLHPQRRRDPEGRQIAEGMAPVGDRFRQDFQARPPRHHSGRGIPRSRRGRDHRDVGGRRSRDRTEKGARAIPSDPGAQRKSVTATAEVTPAAGQAAPLPGQEWRPPSYWPFIVPALVVVLAVIIFPWLFTIWMSMN